MEVKKDYKDITDNQLVLLFKEGDEYAFTEIYKRYRTLMVIHVNNMVKSQDDAKDIVQEIFVWLHRNAATFEIKSSLSDYLYNALRYKVLNAIAQNKTKDNHLESLAKYVEPLSGVADSDSHLKKLTEIIESEIQTMPTGMKEIFELKRKNASV